MALAGFKGVSERDKDRNSIWQQLCSSLLPTLQDPYLRAIFLFLSGKRNSWEKIVLNARLYSGRLEPDSQYKEVMMLEELPLYDRVAFAAVHFADHPLSDWYDRLCEKTVKDGDLSGLLLTGISNEPTTLELFQK